MQRKDSRRLTPEEMNLWKKVIRQTTALHPDRPTPAPETKFRTELSVKAPAKPAYGPIPNFRIGEKSGSCAASDDLAPAASRYLETSPLRMDRKIHDRLKRGKLAPEARIDLHGMSAASAQAKLRSFIPGAHSAGYRLVLVITGKGRNSERDGTVPTHGGVLKRQVPYWLAAPPFSQLILQVSEAHPKHGGAGAYYVYLRRRA